MKLNAMNQMDLNEKIGTLLFLTTDYAGVDKVTDTKPLNALMVQLVNKKVHLNEEKVKEAFIQQLNRVKPDDLCYYDDEEYKVLEPEAAGMAYGEVIEDYEGLFNPYDAIMDHFYEWVETDDEPLYKKDARLNATYTQANAGLRDWIDDLFISVCGYSLETMSADTPMDDKENMGSINKHEMTITRFNKALLTDDEPFPRKGSKLHAKYIDATKEQGAVMNELFITLCGYEWRTIVNTALGADTDITKALCAYDTPQAILDKENEVVSQNEDQCMLLCAYINTTTHKEGI